MHVKRHLRDDRYIMVACCVDGDDYVFLYDADQHSSFLGRDEQAVDLAVFWQRHLEDEDYCIPCELMLCFDEQWVAVPDESPLEMGIESGIARGLIAMLEDEMSALGPILPSFLIKGGD